MIWLRHLTRSASAAPLRYQAHRSYYSHRRFTTPKLQQSVSTPPTPISHSSQSQSLRDRFRQLSRKYGKTALIVYLTMSTTTFSMLYVAIWNGVDVDHLYESVKKHVFGSDDVPQTTSVTEGDYKENAEWIGKKEISLRQKVTSTFLLAFAANKIFSPFKMMITVAVTPSVAKWWRRFRK